MHSNIITTIVTSIRESYHHHHHNTTRASIKKERKEWERIKVTKRRGKKRKEVGSVEWQTCTNRLITFLPLKAYFLLRIKNSFGHKSFKPIPSKWIISTAGSSCEVTHVKEVVPSLALAL